MPIGEKVMRGKVEEQRDDDTDGVGDNRIKTQTEMERYLDNEGYRHTRNARQVEA